MRWIAMLLCAAFAVSVPARSQTLDELKSRFGIVPARIVLRPDFFMFPRFAAERQVCEMSIQKRYATKHGVNLNSDLPDEIIE